MGVIRRKECPEHGANTGMAYTQRGVLHCGNQGARRCGKVLEDREYVLASELRGAVKDLARITELAQAAVRDCRETDKVLAYAHEIAILAAGGQ